ncbi:MAG: hypothetical protein U0T77_08530 [Chitinophagales bacterium]
MINTIHVDSIPAKYIAIDTITYCVNMDTTINKVAYLWNSNSIKSVFGDLTKVINHYDNQDDDVYFVNIKKDSYLRLILFGESIDANNIGSCEVGYTKYLSSNIKLNQSSFTSFFTETNIKLGTVFDTIIHIKGNKYTKVNDKHFFTIKYNCPMETYIGEYTFNNNGELIRFKYGFINP